MTAKIDSVTMYPDKNYLSYDDSDSMIDYFHAYSDGVKGTIEAMRSDGAKVVAFRPVNHRDETGKYAKRVARIAKASGRTATLVQQPYGPTWTLSLPD